MKKNTIILSLVLLMTFSLSVNVFASPLTDNKEGNFNRVLEEFPELKQQLEKDGYTDVVSEENVYLKFELKDDVNKDSEEYQVSDYNVSEISKTEFIRAGLEQSTDLLLENELSKGVKSVRSSQPLSSWGGNYFEDVKQDAYLQLSLCVIRNSTFKHRFTINHNYWWMKQPTFNFADAIGISVGNTMKINSNSYSSKHIVSGIKNKPTVENFSEVLDGTGFVHNNAGVAVKFGMVGSSQDLVVTGQSGYLTCQAEFTQPNVGYQTSNVFGNYIHTQLGLAGGISLDIEGKPSIGINFVDKSYNTVTDVYYQP